MIIPAMARPWIVERLKALGKNKSGLAQTLGLAPSRVSELIKGTREVQIDELPDMARFLQMDISELVSLLTRTQGRLTIKQPLIEVVGHVQAGEWRDATEWSQSERYQVQMPLPSKYKNSKIFGLVNRGDSMNETIPDGAVLACLPLDSHRAPLKSGDCVIVERENAAGEVEATVKQYMEENGEKWLMARSTNPQYRAPIKLNGADTAEVRVLAVVVGHYVDHSSVE